MPEPYEVKCLECKGIIVLVEGTTTKWSHFGGGSYDHEALAPADQAIKSIIEVAQVEALTRPPATEKPVGTFDFEDTSTREGKATLIHVVDLGRRMQGRERG